MDARDVVVVLGAVMVATVATAVAMVATVAIAVAVVATAARVKSAPTNHQ
jgi:hypothetical protein